MSDKDLTAIGFVAADGEDRTFHAPAGSSVAITPVRDFYRIVVTLPNGAVATCIVHERALKVTRESVKLADK